jgi:DNA-binding NarL/FixJ family response regulator
MPAPIRLLLADDSELMRRTICSLLASEPTVSVIGEACSYADVLRLLREQTVDVVLMDLHMPDETRFEAERIKGELRGSCLLAMSIWDNKEAFQLAQSYGASRLLNKAHLVTVLVPAIQECMRQREMSRKAH